MLMIALASHASGEPLQDATALLQLDVDGRHASGDGALADTHTQATAGLGMPLAAMSRARAQAWDRAKRHRQDSSEIYRQSMVNFGDAQYISYMTIGHQLIGGILDTGSFELVVFSSVCTTCGAAAEYNPWLSSSYGVGPLKTTQSYGSGDTFSEEAFDLVSIGPFADTNQTFWEVTKANMPILYNAAFQCIIGVGPPETPASDAWAAIQKTASNISNFTDGHEAVPEELLTQASDRLDVALEMTRRSTLLKTLRVEMFSMCVGRRPGSDGYFIWNDYSAVHNPSLFVEVPVVGTHTWSVKLNNVRIEGLLDPSQRNASDSVAIGCSDGCSAIIDSGTSLLAVPGFIINQLQDMMDKLNSDCSNIYELPNLVFDMGDGTFVLPPDSYVAEVVGAVPNYLENYVTVSRRQPRQFPYRPRSRCQLLLMESYANTKFGALWILGVPFFRRYYTTFKIGEKLHDRKLFIAPATDDCTPENNLASLAATGQQNYLRHVDMARVHVPEVAHRAVSDAFVQL